MPMKSITQQQAAINDARGHRYDSLMLTCEKLSQALHGVEVAR